MMGVIMRILILSFFLLGGSHSQSIEQTSAPQFLREGESLSLKCKYKVSSSPYLFWYVQYPGKCPEVLLHHLLQKESNGFSAKHDPGTTSYNMRRDGVSLSDSGVYLCAVSDGAFGRGTKLTVDIGKRDTSTPSVFVLASKESPSTSCLAKDFYPKDIEMNMSLTPERSPMKVTPLLNSKGLYNAVILKNEHLEACQVKHQGTWVTSQWRGPPPRTDQEDQMVTAEEHGGEHCKEHLLVEAGNTVSLTVLGMRLLFAKTLVFNFLLTANVLIG